MLQLVNGALSLWRNQIRSQHLRPCKQLTISVLGLSSLVFLALPTAAQSFLDTQNHWANACVDRLVQRTQVSGYPDQSFRPENRLTRAEYAALMLKSFPDTVSVASSGSAVPNFKDLPTTHWAYDALRSSYQRGIFVGYPDNTMRPDRPISRAEALAVLYTLVSPTARDGNFRADTLPRFPIPYEPEQVLAELFEDASQAPDWAKTSLSAMAAGFMVVDYPQGQRLRPGQPTTRAEAAAFLCQAAELDGLVPFSAVAGYSQFSQSPELLKLWQLLGEGKQGWFDTQRELTIEATPLPGWEIIDMAQLAENRVATRFQQIEDRSIRYGYFDENGQIAIPPLPLVSAGDFSEGLAWVEQAGKYGFINLSGETVVAAQFDAVQSFSEGLAAVKTAEGWGFIDPTGAWVIHPNSGVAPYRTVSSFSEGLATVSITQANDGQSLYGFIDQSGQAVIAPQFIWAEPFSEGLANVRYKKEGTPISSSGYIDQSGQLILDDLGFEVAPFSEGLAARQVRREFIDRPPYAEIRQYGYIDQSGRWVIEPQTFFGPEGIFFDSAGPFMSGAAAIRIGDRSGLINREGQLITAPIFSKIGEISDGYAHVNYGGVWVNYVGGYDGSASPIVETVLQGGRWGYIKLPLRQQ